MNEIKPTTKPKIIGPQTQETIELLDLIEDNRASTPESDVFMDNIGCPCLEQHPGKETLNKIMPLSVSYIYEALFTKSKFITDNWKTRKLFDLKIKEWEKTDENTSIRNLEYKIELGPLGNPINYEVQV